MPVARALGPIPFGCRPGMCWFRPYNRCTLDTETRRLWTFQLCHWLNHEENLINWLRWKLSIGIGYLMTSKSKPQFQAYTKAKIPYGCTEFPQFHVISKSQPQHFDKSDDLSFCVGFRSLQRASSQKESGTRRDLR
ncbi:hypothetical protein CEXT_102941 [Caerostris extrusa]|uniref:Uncharacterized protein n=1 Tax=Caerostris extrusa TaxID=172846 RepID=A0AAV4X3B3_CAEEX|nr:hypothetical protein CEXT_102941 [Caerostris extrusa]